MGKINILYDQTPESGKKSPPPPPTPPACADCGDRRGPWWGFDGDVFCSEHAPAFLKRPADYNHDGEPYAKKTDTST
jgi:hypothetical protein